MSKRREISNTTKPDIEESSRNEECSLRDGIRTTAAFLIDRPALHSRVLDCIKSTYRVEQRQASRKQSLHIDAEDVHVTLGFPKGSLPIRRKESLEGHPYASGIADCIGKDGMQLLDTNVEN